MIRIARTLAIAVVLTAATLLRAPEASAQQTTICTGQPVPAGYVVVAAYRVQECPGYYTSNQHNSLTIALAGDRVTVCSALSPRPAGYAVVAAYRIQECPDYYSSNEPNSHVLQRPGETVTVCSAFTTSLPGYVITAQQRVQECPGYFSGYAPNSATYRRLAQPAVVDAPPPDADGLAMLDDHERAVHLRMREMEEWLGLGEPTHAMWRASAQSGATTRASMQAQGGTRYTVVGVCDDDCTDLDLRVSDGGRVLASNEETDAHPWVEVATARNSTLTVEAIMASCRSGPCRFGVAVYETPAVAEAPSGTPLRRERIQPPGTVRPAPRQRP